MGRGELLCSYQVRRPRGQPPAPRSGAVTGSGRRTMLLITVKTAVLVPMLTASVSTATLS